MTTTGTAKTHKRKREALTQRLRAQGLDEDFITHRIGTMKARQEAERHGDPAEAARLAQIERELIHETTYRTTRLDDTGYKPRAVDPLERGPARVNPRTAKAARRRDATTRFELAEREAI